MQANALEHPPSIRILESELCLRERHHSHKQLSSKKKTPKTDGRIIKYEQIIFERNSSSTANKELVFVPLDEEFGEKSVSVLLDDEESELIFVDHPSAEMSPENCITTYQPQAYIIVYSVVDRLSFQIAEETLQSLWKTDSIGSKAVILVGNKTDLVRSRTITSEEGKNMATSYDCKFIETSVGINHNVDELLVGILTQIRLKLQQATKPKRNKSPLGRCIGKDNDSPKKWSKSRLTASLKVKGLLGRVWARDSRSKSCENLHVL
ncbi:hypothetical protein RUM44_001870 [Polyplax serrata]|uniref:Uncharacterized protein n=1 Tax=Polyplax serrata TaxID=468196 RepID=A0ABR1AL82_POLSC